MAARMDFSSKYMAMALAEAAAAADMGEVPVGAVIVHEPTKRVLARAANRVVVDRDPSAHAELLAIRQACRALDSERLTDCDLYVTLEPCPMCAQLIAFARLRRLYFAAYDEKGGGVENGPRIFHAKSCHHRPEIYGGLGEGEASRMLKEFFQARRR